MLFRSELIRLKKEKTRITHLLDIIIADREYARTRIRALNQTILEETAKLHKDCDELLASNDENDTRELLESLEEELLANETELEGIRNSQSQQEAEKMRQDGENQRQEAELKFKAEQADLDRQAEIQVAEIRSAGFGATVDINQNQQSDYTDALKEINRTQAQNDNISLQREKNINQMAEHQDKMGIEREKLDAQMRIAQTQLEIARENKNKFDKKSSEKNKKK